KRTAADSAKFGDDLRMNPNTMSAFATAQARADAVAALYGSSAARPMDGESLRAYRRRLLQPYKDLHPDWKGADLRDVKDAGAFDAAENAIYAAAADEARHPRVMPGHLISRSVDQGGHTMTTWHGSPIVWMERFMPRARAVTRINIRQPGIAYSV